MFFRSVELTFFVNSFISCGMASPHIIDASDFAIRKVSFNPNKGRLSVMNLRSLGPVAGQPISVKVKYRIPFSEPIQRSVRGNLVHFKTKWGPKIQFSCILLRVLIVAMLHHRPFKTSNENVLWKNVIYWLNHIDFQIQEIFPSRLANPINKPVLRTRLFIGFATLSGNISMWINLYLFEPSHDKTNKMTVRLVKTQSSLCAQWVAKDLPSSCGQRRLWSDWTDAQADLSSLGEYAILLVLSWGGSFVGILLLTGVVFMISAILLRVAISCNLSLFTLGTSCGQGRLWSDWAHMPFCWICHEAAHFVFCLILVDCSVKPV